MKRITKHKLDLILSWIIEIGLVLSLFLVTTGGVAYLIPQWNIPVKYHIFTAEPENLNNLFTITKELLKGNAAAVIQMGVVLLLVTPALGTAICTLYFYLRKDWLYLLLSLFVLVVLTLANMGALRN